MKGQMKGQMKGEERVRKLNLLLMAEKRYDDLERASKDKEYRRQLLTRLEYKLKAKIG